MKKHDPAAAPPGGGPGIQKRLSWNYGQVQIHNVSYRADLNPDLSVISSKFTMSVTEY